MGCGSSNQTKDILPHLVIVGFQYGGFNLLQQVKDNFRVTVIDKKDFFEWTTATPHSMHVEGCFESKSENLHTAINSNKVFGSNVKFIQGLVDEVVDEHSIKYKPTKGKNSSSIGSASTKSLEYDYLAL